MADRTAARRLDRWLARGAAATTALATLTLSASLVVGVATVATTAPALALVAAAVAAGALVVAAMLARAALALRASGGVSIRAAGAVALLRSLAFAVEFAVVVGGVVAVGWGFGVVGAADGVPATVSSGRVVYGAFGLFVLVVGSLPVFFRAARRGAG